MSLLAIEWYLKKPICWSIVEILEFDYDSDFIVSYLVFVFLLWQWFSIRPNHAASYLYSAHTNHIHTGPPLFSKGQDSPFVFWVWDLKSASKWGMKYLYCKVMALLIVNFLEHKSALKKVGAFLPRQVRTQSANEEPERKRQRKMRGLSRWRDNPWAALGCRASRHSRRPGISLENIEIVINVKRNVFITIWKELLFHYSEVGLLCAFLLRYISSCFTGKKHSEHCRACNVKSWWHIKWVHYAACFNLCTWINNKHLWAVICNI